MGRRKDKHSIPKSHTLPSSPTHSLSSSSSSSDFEFTISLSPRKSSAANLCPADELFYKGQLLPLHLSPRISMVRTLLLASSSTSSSSDTTTTASRDSTGSSSNDSRSSFSGDLFLLPECDSSRPSSAADPDDEYKRLTNPYLYPSTQSTIKKSKYFSFSRFSSVFKKDPKAQNPDPSPATASPVKRMSTTAKEVIRKYLRKVKPIYEKLSQNQNQKQQQQQQHSQPPPPQMSQLRKYPPPINKDNQRKESNNATLSQSFSGNLRYPIRRRSIVSSCPSSMRSSPSHSGVLSSNGFPCKGGSAGGGGYNCNYADTSSMEELQSAIQGAIAHCKNSMLQNNKSLVSNEI